MASKRGTRNVTHTPVSLGEKTPPHDVTIRVDDATERMYLHQSVIDLRAGDRQVVGIDSGAGLGGDFIVINYTDAKGVRRRGVCYMREIAREWIRAVDPDAPAKLLDALTVDREEASDAPA